MIVVDTSAVLDSLAGRPVDPALQARLAEDGDLHVPHLIDVELLHALRRLVRTGVLTQDRGCAGPSRFRRSCADPLPAPRPRRPQLGAGSWELRDNLTATATATDAAFVALAETLETALVTTDARLARHVSAAELFTRPAPSWARRRRRWRRAGGDQPLLPRVSRRPWAARLSTPPRRSTRAPGPPIMAFPSPDSPNCPVELTETP